ncbi:MAG: hypothetical protein ACOC2H_10105, partial [Spirochaetota bacterium]
YPLLSPVLFLLSAASLLSLYLVRRLTLALTITQNNPVSAIGRFALTTFFVHLYVKEAAYTFHFVDTFSKWQTIGVTLLFLALCGGVSLLLRPHGYRYSLEWLLRRLG